RLDEAAAAEAPQPVALVVELLGPLAAFGEDEHELALVVEQPVNVRGMRRDAADLRDQHREPGIALEEVLDGDVERARVRGLLLDRLRDHRRVRRQRSGVVRDEQRAAVRGDVLYPLDLGPEPVAVVEVDEGAIEDLLDPLRAPPVVELAVGLDGGQRVAPALAGDGGEVALVGARLLLRARSEMGWISGHESILSAIPKRRLWQSPPSGQRISSSPDANQRPGPQGGLEGDG